MALKVLSVASECTPLIKTGGLADVVGALPGALAKAGVEMRVMLPAYPGLAERLSGRRRLGLDLGKGESAAVIQGKAEGLTLYLVEAPQYFEREGNPYTGPEGRDWPDNAERFAYFARVAAAAARQGLGRWHPAAVHAHDWQAALVPVWREEEGGGPPVLLTIHNIAFQGLYAPAMLERLGLSQRWNTIEGMEFHGRIGFLKGGLALAERLSTVSPTYARELMTPAFGMGLDGLLRHRAEVFSGILNGIDLDAWNPSDDPALAARFSAAKPTPRTKNRRALEARFRLDPAPHAPLFIVVSRMTRQKGLDLLLGAVPELVGQGARLAVLGSGEPDLEQGFAEAARTHAGRVGVVIGYDEALSHLMQGGGDAILIPSRFEPCGLTQLYGLRYGCLPVAARTGGLADTIVEANVAALRAGVATGVLHAPDDADALTDAITKTIALHAEPGRWKTMRAQAMAQSVGWERSAAEYAALYREMVTDRAG